jgi:large subunit ribosomal protein L25
MSKNYAMTAAKRERAGKGVARSLRRDGLIPAVIYGDNKEPIKISMNLNAINVEYNRGHMYTNLCELTLDGQKHLVLARDVQLHPVTDVVEHVDFLRVSAKTKIAVMVPVHFIDQDKCPGLDRKAILNVVRHEVELWCSATDIPEQLDVSLAGKDFGDAVKISNAHLPKGASPVITNRDFTIATVVAPKTLEQEAAEEAAMAAAGDGVPKEEPVVAAAPAAPAKKK